jgi:Pyruvate/2-oxoacid:ferredoxin oxidoreductase delta subunit
MPRQKNAPVLTVATRGALRIGPLKIPGAAGFANFFAALILFVKGYKVRGFFSLDMPSNFINVHPGLSNGSVKRISDKAKSKIVTFMQPIMSERRLLLTLNNLYEGIWTAFLFWLIPIFPILYLIYGKTSMAKMMFSNNRCVSCGICAKICPNHAIEMKTFLGEKRPFWTYHCENCMRCMSYCPQKAVEAGHSFAIIQYIFITTLVVAKLFPWLTAFTGFSYGHNNYWIMILLESLYYVPALFLSYWIFWMLIRIPAVNTIFSITTLTHYFKRYHEPETRIKDLKQIHKRETKLPASE